MVIQFQFNIYSVNTYFQDSQKYTQLREQATVFWQYPCDPGMNSHDFIEKPEESFILNKFTLHCKMCPDLLVILREMIGLQRILFVHGAVS